MFDQFFKYKREEIEKKNSKLLHGEQMSSAKSLILYIGFQEMCRQISL